MKRFIIAVCSSMPVFAVCLVVSQIILSNQLVGSGKAVRNIDLTIDAIRSENESLDHHVASASSLITISERATQLGFVEPEKTQYVTLDVSTLPVAFHNPQ